MSGDMPKEWNLGILALAIVSPIVMTMVLAFGPHPPPPDRRKALGCYANAAAPWMRLTNVSAEFGQRGFAATTWHLEDQKRLTLTVDIPITAVADGDGHYRFALDRVGIGKFLFFVKQVKGIERPVFNDNESYRFEMPTHDGSDLIFERVGDEICDEQVKA